MGKPSWESSEGKLRDFASSSLQQRWFKAHSILQLETKNGWAFGFFFLNNPFSFYEFALPMKSLKQHLFAVENPWKLLSTSNARKTYQENKEPGLADDVPGAHNGLCSIPRLGANRCAVCPSSLQHSLPMGTKFWKGDDKFANIGVSSQHSLEKCFFLSKIWKVFPTTAVQTKPPAAPGSGTEAPHHCSVPKLDFLLSTLHLHGACVKAASVNIPSTHRHIPTYTPPNISHALFSWIFLWMKPQCSKHSQKENRSSHRLCLSELSNAKENLNQHVFIPESLGVFFIHGLPNLAHNSSSGSSRLTQNYKQNYFILFH